MENTIQIGDSLEVSYVAKTNSDTILSQVSGQSIIVGNNQLISGLDEKLIGTQAENFPTSYTFTFPGIDIYPSNYKANNVQEVPTHIINDLNITPRTGEKILRDQTIAYIQAVTNTHVLIDTNPSYLRENIDIELTIHQYSPANLPSN